MQAQDYVAGFAVYITLSVAKHMSRKYKLLLFYAVALLIGADLYVITSRFFLASPDPVAWEKIALAAILQAAALASAAYYFRWLSRTKHSLVPARSLFTLDLALVPVVAVGLVAALSVSILANATNCGNHPLPANRGEKNCPK